MSLETWKRLSEGDTMSNPLLPDGPHPVNMRPPTMVASGAPKYEFPKHLRDEPTVTINVPHAINFNLDNYEGLIKLSPGIQELPASLVTGYQLYDRNGNKTTLGMHWYLTQQGVTIYVPPSPVPPEALAEQLRAQGFKV